MTFLGNFWTASMRLYMRTARKTQSVTRPGEVDMSEIMKGNKVQGKLRAPKQNAADRVCVERGCTTRLSTYNKREYCYAHAPTKFPRLRGRVAPES